MDIRKRLFRSPVTTVLWTILLTVMALMISVGSALMYSSGSMAGILDQYHTSIAVSTDQSEYEEVWDGMTVWVAEDMKLFQEDIDYLKNLDSVEEVYFQTLTGGYCPDFIPALGAERYSNINETYYNVMVAGKVVKILQMQDEGYTYDMTNIGLSDQEPLIQCYLEIEVEEILHANSSYLRGDETHMNVSLQLVGQEAMDYIQEGQRYLFFGECDPRDSFYPDVPGMRGLKKLNMRFPTAYRNGQLDQLVYEEILLGDDMTFGDPFMAKLEGTVEEFLADPDNGAWVQMADSWDKLQHSLPVIGTDAVECMYAFVDKRATLEEGRFFTQEEYDTGAKVCMLSHSLAARSGIQVGDTITLSQFLCGNEPFDDERNSSLVAFTGMMNNPTCGAFVRDLEFETENQEFTVVGLYRLSNEWEDTSYSFTPNTVFVPKLAQPEGAFGGMSGSAIQNVTDTDGKIYSFSTNNDGGTFGIYLTLKLKNAEVNAFKAAIAQTEFADRFITKDQGYEKVLVGLNALSASALKLMAAVGAGWLLLVGLYLLLYQGSQRKNLGIMRSQGAVPSMARNYLFGSGMALAVVGICIGTTASIAVIGYVQRSLVTSAFGQAVLDGGTILNQEVLEALIHQSQLPGWMLILTALAQAALFALILWIQAALMAGKPPRKLLSK